jgi:hypothetical protein
MEPVKQDSGHVIARLYRMLERDYFSASVGDEHDVFGQQRQHMIDVPLLEGCEEPADPFKFDRFGRDWLLLGYFHLASCPAHQLAAIRLLLAEQFS